MKTMNLYKYIFLLCMAMSAISMTYSQQSIDSVANSLQNKFRYKSPELVYLQLSKGTYETGEDLWFKAYELDAQTMGLSDKSKTLYLQMVNNKDSVVWQEKYPIDNGIASGHVYINENLSEGDYFLEGYTKYSFYKNDTTGLLPARKVKIVKNISRVEVAKNKKDTTFRFEMFPEGGNFVSGIPSKLAFKATDGNATPVSVEGLLYQDNELLSTIKSTHDGMGAILFVPHRDRKYRIELNNGKSLSLPDICQEGMVLQLSKQDKKQLDFIVSKSTGLPNQQIYLIGQMRGTVCCIAKGILKDSLKITIPLTNFLYQGIAEFTLFNEAMQPFAERLVYIHPDKKLHIMAEPDKKSFATREKATIKIKVTDEYGKPVKVNLGVSVYDRTYDNLSDPVNMLTYCYLSSQIRGQIYNPAYYFDEKNNNRTEAMELLLLTQGWRRYVWNAAGSVSEGELFLIDELQGTQTIKSKKKSEQNQETEQLIQLSGAEGNSLFIWANSEGQFTISPDMMKELRGGYIYLKPMLSKEFKPKLELVDYFSKIDSIKTNLRRYYPTIDLSQYKKETILDLPVVSGDSTILLTEVSVTGKGKNLFRDKMMGRLDSLAQLNLNHIWICGTCGLLLNYKSGYDGHHAVNNCPAKSMSQPIDGQKYKIAKYEHFPSTGNGVPFRVVDIQEITYHALQYSEEELLHINNLWRTKGYYAVREFYQPDEIDMQSSIPDARNTLIWQPSVITDEKGEATVSFYCSDINTGFTGLVEGVDGMGLLGSAKCEFRVVRHVNQ